MRRLTRPSPCTALTALAALAALGIAPLSACRSVHPIAAIQRKLASLPRQPFKRVTPAVAYEITRDSPNALILDLRRPTEFQSETGHLLHAWNIPLARLPYRLLDLSPYREETFLVYCRGDDTCGEDGMRILTASGFEDAILIDGGIDGWIKRGYKTALSLVGAPPARQKGPEEPPTEPTPPPP
jgi:phage shock protein E